MTKIDIVSGFLGAGKTTLIKKMLSEAYQGEKLVLIENEFGEISIDGGFLKDSGVQISEMSSGCICCSLVGDFNKALRQVHEQFAPDRILIEPSGVGKLSDVIVAVENTVRDEPDMKLNSFVTVADATKVKVYMKNFGEFYNNQIESAGTIILSRTQKLSQEKLEAAVALLREKNPPPSSLPRGTSWTARLFCPLWKRSLWPMSCWPGCRPSTRRRRRSTTITTTTMMSMMTMTTMTSITIIMTTTRTRATAAAAITTTMMTMTTNMSITITRAAATMTTRSTSTMMSMSTTITTTASATTRSAPVTTITTTPTRCSPAGAPRRSTPTRRRTSAAS
jgi:hypothetical protein